MADKYVVGRLTVTKNGPVIQPLPARPHPDTCWCRPPDVALAALKKAEGRTS